MFFIILVIIVWVMPTKRIHFIEASKVGGLTLGILVVAIPLLIYLLIHGTVSEYIENLHFILNDSEYSKSIFVKLFESQYRLFRVYWRAWFPLVIIDVFYYCFRNRKKAFDIAYALSNIVFIYVIIRFAFIYGSVSINLTVAPIVFLALQSITLIAFSGGIEKCINDIIWIFVGYLFYVCEYLATDTEILSSSAVFIVIVIPTIRLWYFTLQINNATIVKKEFFNNIIFIIYIACLFILRMTFMWGDSPIQTLDCKITNGLGKGIITTSESAEIFTKAEMAISNINYKDDDEVLILPINPTYYYFLEASCAAPYIFRFETNIGELENYYSLHPDKMPSVIIALKNDNSGNEYNMDECIEYFENMEDMGYYVYCDNDDVIVLKR